VNVVGEEHDDDVEPDDNPTNTVYSFEAEIQRYVFASLGNVNHNTCL
jgi:hypothetical protein